MTIVLLFLFGLAIGSFLGALTYRLPRNISIGKGRSFCPNCKKQIKWFDNIPVFSFLILGGKCRNCSTKISFRYPLIEVATAITFVLVGFNIFNLIIASILIAIFVIDIEHQIIPDSLVFGGFLIVIYNLLQGTFFWSNLLVGFLAADALLLLHLVTRGKGMGLGDVKLALLLGAIAGIYNLWTWLFFSFLSGAVVGIILLLVKHATMKQKIAFGPFLIIGLILTNYFGPVFLKLFY